MVDCKGRYIHFGYNYDSLEDSKGEKFPLYISQEHIYEDNDIIDLSLEDAKMLVKYLPKFIKELEEE